jgi:hypothetical protein
MRKIPVPFVVFFAFFYSWACLGESSFSYDVTVSKDGYDLNVDCAFPREVTLSQVVHNLKSLTLFSDLNSTMLPSESVVKSESQYSLITNFKAAGFHFKMLSDCSDVGDIRHFERKCLLDPKLLDGSKFMEFKSDQIKCSENDDHLVDCRLRIQGKLKKIPLLSSAKLTLKAKYQSLVNWASFWYFTESGSISTQYSQELFHKSKLKLAIDDLLRTSLDEARKSSESDFRFSQRGTFTP